ncbi:hypothetical protein TrVE_jg12144 [Triparma verrucosa]|nr:hypothetical protein TrST_g132 [Triparma strigata]GMI04936.1 hypothetical protein TrVE_jg12144 [Triparma verrucosa]
MGNARQPLLDASPYSRSSTRGSMSDMTPSQIVRSFLLMSICFSANHGAVTACLGLASARLGDLTYLDADLGTWQNGTLYTFYTLSAVFGATYVVDRLGSRNGILAGVSIYCVYVCCFLVASLVSDANKWPVALIGAAIGGVGGGFLWTAQGAYFGKTAAAYALACDIPKEDATAYLGGLFAFFYLSEEVALKLLSTLITQVLELDWLVVFISYSVIAFLSAVGILFVYKFPEEAAKENDKKDFCYKVTAATRLLTTDTKMPLMIPMNAVFGFAAAFLNSYVTGQVIHFATTAPGADPVNGLDNYVGTFTAIPAAVAAVMSLILGKVAAKTGKGPILIGGACAFAALASVFLIRPGLDDWGWAPLITVFILMGMGRATFESTLRATFADFFSSNLPGAFANIILQSGLSSAFAFFAFPHITCDEESDYCVEYKGNGGLHNVLALELIVIVTALLAILGYWKASKIRDREILEEKEGGDLVEKV